VVPQSGEMEGWYKVSHNEGQKTNFFNTISQNILTRLSHEVVESDDGDKFVITFVT
jgi:hypothetical protein